MYSTMCFTSAGTSWPLIVCVRVTSSNGTPKTRVVPAELPPSLPGNGDTLFLMAASSSPQPRQDLTSSKGEIKAEGGRSGCSPAKKKHHFRSSEWKNTTSRRSEEIREQTNTFAAHKQTKMSIPLSNLWEWLAHTLLHVSSPFNQERRGGGGQQRYLHVVLQGGVGRAGSVGGQVQERRYICNP